MTRKISQSACEESLNLAGNATILRVLELPSRMALPLKAAFMSGNSRGRIDALLLQRVYGEFLEMPGLRLTCQQAQRLWGLDAETCRELLDFLVDEKFLLRATHGAYSRLTG